MGPSPARPRSTPANLRRRRSHRRPISARPTPNDEGERDAEQRAPPTAGNAMPQPRQRRTDALANRMTAHLRDRASCRIAVHPSDAGVVHLHPCVRVRAAKDALTWHRRQIAVDVARDKSRRNPLTPQHDDSRGRELLAKPLVRNEKKVIDRIICSAGSGEFRLYVSLAAQVVVDCIHGSEAAPRTAHQRCRECGHTCGQIGGHLQRLRVDVCGFARREQRGVRLILRHGGDHRVRVPTPTVRLPSARCRLRSLVTTPGPV